LKEHFAGKCEKLKTGSSEYDKKKTKLSKPKSKALKGNLHEHMIHKSVWTNYENRMGRNLRKKKNVEKDGIGFMSRKKMNNKTV
jgi:hypothetical protein